MNWDSLVADNKRTVMSIAYRYTKNRATSEDLSQDVFMKVFLNIDRFDEAKGTFHNWIVTMAHRVCIDTYRKSVKNKTISIDALVGFEPGVEDNQEAKLMVIEAKTQMTPELALIVDGFSYEEAAMQLGINVGTVKSRVNRNRKELRSK